MGKLISKFFDSALDVCDFVNKNNVVLKHVAIKVVEDHHGIPNIEYVAFYEEKENGKNN